MSFVFEVEEYTIPERPAAVSSDSDSDEEELPKKALKVPVDFRCSTKKKVSCFIISLSNTAMRIRYKSYESIGQGQNELYKMHITLNNHAKSVDYTVALSGKAIIRSSYFIACNSFFIILLFQCQKNIFCVSASRRGQSVHVGSRRRR